MKTSSLSSSLLLLLLLLGSSLVNSEEINQSVQTTWIKNLNEYLGIEWKSVADNVVIASKFLNTQMEWLKHNYAEGIFFNHLQDEGLHEDTAWQPAPENPTQLNQLNQLKSARKVERKAHQNDARDFEPVLPEFSRPKRDVVQRDAPGDDFCNHGGTEVVGDVMYVCPGDTLTQEEYDSSELPLCSTCVDSVCESACCNATTAACACFHGRFGDHCENIQPYECQLVLLSPNLACTSDPDEILDPNYYKSNSCRKYSISGKVNLEYKVSCLFRSADYNFTTFVTQNAFPQDEVESFVHGVNFCRLTDFSKGDRGVVTTEHFLGLQNLTFTLDLKTFTSNPRFVAGGRLYFETRFVSSAKPSGMANNPTDKQFVDFNDWTYTIEKETLSPGAIAAIVLGSICGAVLLVGIGLYFFREYKKGKAPGQ